MTIESEAQKDLALSDEDADGVVGGKRTRKARNSTKANTSSVWYVNVPAGSPQAQESADPTGWGDDCAPEDPTAT